MTAAEVALECTGSTMEMCLHRVCTEPHQHPSDHQHPSQYVWKALCRASNLFFLLLTSSSGCQRTYSRVGSCQQLLMWPWKSHNSVPWYLTKWWHNACDGAQMGVPAPQGELSSRGINHPCVAHPYLRLRVIYFSLCLWS